LKTFLRRHAARAVGSYAPIASPYYWWKHLIIGDASFDMFLREELKRHTRKQLRASFASSHRLSGRVVETRRQPEI